MELLPPGEGWLRLNTDGASRGNPGAATAGGALRDRTGAGMRAWKRKVTRLELEVDSELVVGFLKSGVSDSNPLSFLVRLCHDFISRDSIVRISHVYREANCLADGLVNHAFSLPPSFHLLESASTVVEELVRDDARGTAFPRIIRD
ncbi:Ribonuclease H domain [Arabidopsis thaliana x Arabidopsis arenosa]|uniref:Ribonuclease H domain n=1 Tax=Arabidopsis thaliana x Arabidopsis arenosa TaxID=1240361 RepID=A0A8T2BYC9_9BRAS|nr:Ribonuclease H domain [Arabidopsis thaliana x Arabidopsis arenosa]